MSEGKVSRRGFLKDAAIGAVTVAGVGAFAANSASAQTQAQGLSVSKARRVVIIGGGGSGHTAAVAALQAGMGTEITVLEKNSTVGGITQLSTANAWACNTRYQKKAGMKGVSQTDGLKVYLDTGEWAQPETTILTRYLENSAELVDWLIGLGVPWSGTPGPGFFHPFQAIRKGAGRGSGTVDTLNAYAKEHGVKFELNTRANEIIMKDGKVAGVKATKEGRPVEYQADAVVLCDGGTWGAGWEELKQYIPPEWKSITQKDLFAELAGNWGKAGTGDAARMAKAVGAQLQNMEDLEYTAQGWFNAAGEKHPRATMSASLWHDSQAIILNQNMERFVNEVPGTKTGVSDGVIKELTKRHETWFWSVLDAQGRDVNYVVQTELQRPETFSKGFMLVGNTIEELAGKMGVDPKKLQAALDKYNSYFDKGMDKDPEGLAKGLGKDPEFGRQLIFPIRKAPFYALRQGLMISCVIGGILVDAEMRVLDKNNAAIPGLYAAGQSVDSFLYNGNGSVTGGFSTMLVLGRIAGENAARGDMGAGVRQGLEQV